MRFIVGIGSLLLILFIFVDAFEAVLLPRRVSHKYRFLRFFYRHTWRVWRIVVGLIPSPRRRETALSLFGPLALLVLFGTWAAGLIAAFASLHWALGTPLTAAGKPASPLDFGDCLYFSGVTFFTLGYGDMTPAGGLGKFLAVVETGLGFGFLAMVISYHPVLTQAFSRREILISLLDARGGSPPTAAQVLIRDRRFSGLTTDITAWEVWSAELLESSLSFPMLAYYRSQHDNQSWLAALTCILDTCALEICGVGTADPRQVRLTFAIARHAAVDLTLVFSIKSRPLEHDRLSSESFQQLKSLLEAEGIRFPESAAAETKLAELRGMYEPFLNGLSQYFLFRLPDFFPARATADNWQTSAWMPRTPGIIDLPTLERGEHFE